MLSNPRVGQTVQVWYAARRRSVMHLHGKIGRVEIVSRKRPRNHGMRVDGILWVVPAGNLRLLAGEGEEA